VIVAVYAPYAATEITPMRQKQVYIAGPMSGLPEFNFPAFFAAQKRLEARGWIVHNPAEKDQEHDLDKEAVKTGDDRLAMANGFDFRGAYLWDVTKIIQGNAIYMLKGWESSRGAFGEWAVAQAMKSKFPDYEIMYE
jgi:hypothetical protein